jgi:hypothetical protein
MPEYMILSLSHPFQDNKDRPFMPGKEIHIGGFRPVRTRSEKWAMTTDVDRHSKKAKEKRDKRNPSMKEAMSGREDLF